MANVLPPFPSFSVHEDNGSVGPRWKKWLKHSGMYLVTHDVKDATPRERGYYTPLVKKSATYLKLFPIKKARRTMRKQLAALNGYFQKK